MRRFLIVLICLLTVLSLFSGCKAKEEEPEIKTVETAPYNKVRTIYGPRGANRVFYWDVIKPDGSIDSFEVKTNEKTVGAALSNVALAKFVEDDEGNITETSISGYDLEEGMKWAFFINGELSSQNPNKTEIKNRTIYSFSQVKAK